MTPTARDGQVTSEIVGAEWRIPAMRGNALPIVSLLAALACWIVGLPQVDPAKLNDFGIVAILPWTIWLSIGFVSVGFAASVARVPESGVLPFLLLIVLILVLHATPAISYETLRYSWAWKHLGIVDYIQRNGTIDPLAPYLSANHNWPGFFFLVAWVADILEIGPVQLSESARFAPTLFNVAFLLALIPILRRLTDDLRLVWTAALIFVTGNWVGQDYFSPQAAAFLLYLVLLGVCLGPLGVRPAVTREGGSLWRFISHVRILATRSVPIGAKPGAAGRVGFTIAAFVIPLVVAATHQLTPVVLVSALAGLALVGRLSPIYAVFAAITTALWFLYFAAPFLASNLPGEIERFGDAIGNAADNLIDTTLVSSGQAWIARASRGLTAAIGVMAVVGGFRRLSAGHRDGTAIVLTLAPLPLLAATSYGGEAIFRVYLFALPGLAFFAAAGFFTRLSKPPGVRRMALIGGLALLLSTGFLLANNGKDQQYHFFPDEVEAALWLYENAPRGSLLIEGARNYPSQFLNYEYFGYLTLSTESADTIAEVMDDPAGVLARWLDGSNWSSGFVVLTHSQRVYLEALGVLPAGGFDRMLEALLSSPKFMLVFASEHARVFAPNAAAMVIGEPAGD